MTLKKAVDEGFSEFNHIYIDGTIKKAYNSKNNVITKKEVKILIQCLKEAPITEKNLKKLHKPAQKILKKKNIGKS